MAGFPEIAGYQIECELGRGGMGCVYLARHEGLDRLDVLKVMLIGQDLTAEQRSQLQDRFIQEAKVLAKLRHPHIVSVYDIKVSAQGLTYIAMEYIAGGDLKQYISRYPEGVPPTLCHQWLKPLLEALGYAHQRGIVHRDLKPANILFREEGGPVLADFGIAKLLGEAEKLTRTGVALGTAAYIAPEQAQGAKLDARADLYGLGIILFEMLTGQLPYRAETFKETVLQHLFAPVPRLPQHLASWQPILDKLLAKEPEARYVSAAAVWEAVAGMASAEPSQLPMTALATVLEQGAISATSVRSRPVAKKAYIGQSALLAILLIGLVGLLGKTLLWTPPQVGLETPEQQPGKAAVPRAEIPELIREPMTGMELVRIPAGCFQMGSPATEAERVVAEGPQHQVCVNEAYYMGKYEVTQAQWQAVMGNNPAKFTGPDRPVEQVSWDDAQAFVAKLSSHGGAAYRLPSEAEWEYAARAGTITPFSTGQCIHTDQANYAGNEDYNKCGAKTGVDLNKTQPVGSYPANAWGLHDMPGNVWEWMADCWHENYLGAPVEGSAWVIEGDCGRRILRGGSWSNGPRYLRSALRGRDVIDDRDANVGFRVVRKALP